MSGGELFSGMVFTNMGIGDELYLSLKINKTRLQKPWQMVLCTYLLELFEDKDHDIGGVSLPNTSLGW